MPLDLRHQSTKYCVKYIAYAHIHPPTQILVYITSGIITLPFAYLITLTITTTSLIQPLPNLKVI